jgi:DNA-binding NtrC family response regulator
VATTQDTALLFVDDDEEFRTVAVQRFRKCGFRVSDAADGEGALALVQRRHFDVAVLDMRMPGMSGLDLLEKLKTVDAECEAIILTGEGTIDTAVKAMKLGAFDYLTKPFSLAELEGIVLKASEQRRLRRENVQLKEMLARTQSVGQMIGESAAMREVYRLIERAGSSDKAILICGASGTGKELVAKALHQRSSRADRPMVVINCAALPETLLESELFGHEKGAFTGAAMAKPGLCELADGGTLFIDEIGEMPTPLQAKLLRVLEDGSMRRIGSLKERRVNVRLLAATHRDLAQEIQAGRFREDLYYRINVMTINLPLLKDRDGDIRLLVRHFLGSDWDVEPDALVALEHYHWPGNVRQLINVIDRAKILAEHRCVGLCDLPSDIVESHTMRQPMSAKPMPHDLATIEKTHVIEVLRREQGNKARAARALGVSRRSLYRLLEKHAIEMSDFEIAPIGAGQAVATSSA